MGGGGKGGAPQSAAPAYVDPVDGTTYQSPGDLNYHISQRGFADAEKTAADKDAATAKTAADETAFQGRKSTAYNDALTAVQRKFQLQGLDPNAYMTSDITPTLTRQMNSIPDMDPNPSSAFTASTADDILNGLTSSNRTNASRQLDSTFAPDYASTILPDSTISQYAPGILDEQFNPLKSQLENAHKRHTLDDRGYAAALDTLGQKRTSAEAQVNTLGKTILGTDRSALDDIVSGARSTAAGLSLGQTFDPTSYASKANNRAWTDLGNFGGELRSAIGDTKYATLGELINSGGATQGANNPNAANPAGGIAGTSGNYVAPDELAKRSRGLGNTGAF